MRAHASAFCIGAVFGVGLAVSGMTNPAKVIGFLNVAGAWDASLMLVMAGAVSVYAILARLVMRRQRPIFGGGFAVSKNQRIDVDLVAGSAIFGAGWGLAGYCPGPALVSLASRSWSVVAFVASMTLGMVLYRLVRPAEASHATSRILSGAGSAK